MSLKEEIRLLKTTEKIKDYIIIIKKIMIMFSQSQTYIATIHKWRPPKNLKILTPFPPLSRYVLNVGRSFQ